MKSYTHFTLSERESLQLFLEQDLSMREIARRLNRDVSSVSREIKRNLSKKKNRYNAWRATTLYIVRRKKCVRKFKITVGSELYYYILDKLNQYWTPEQIAERAKREGYDISFSAIYLAIKRGVFKEVTRKSHLRRRGKRKHNKNSNCNSIQPIHTIHDRPKIVEENVRYGDFEGDTIYGAVGKGCIVTLVDRKSKLLLAALSKDRNSENIRKAFVNAFKCLDFDIPIESITLDNGSEFAAFEKIEKDLQTTIYFADPHSPWQRGLNENTNDLLRFFFPKGTNFHNVTDEELQTVVALINNRPRKTLDFFSPIEVLSKKCCT